MPMTKEWSFLLNEHDDRLFVQLVIEHGDVLNYAVRYHVETDGALRLAVLCDGAHGQGHCHRIGWDGAKLDRVYATNADDLAASASEAIDDLSENWERHRAAFLRRRP
jgi:hypothetical protein